MTPSRIMTLNLWQRCGPWTDRVREIGAWLSLLRPDVVCFQEVVEGSSGDATTAHEIAHTVSPLSYHVIVDGFVPGGGFFGNAVLSREEPEWVETTSLPEGPGEREGSRFALRVETASVEVVCTHLSWCSFEHGAIRERQVVALDDALKAHSASDKPLVVCGDFNAEPESTEVRFMSGLCGINAKHTYYQDAWRVGGGVGNGFTWSNCNPLAAGAHAPDRRLDYIFVRWDNRAFRSVIMSVGTCCDRPLSGSYASDHYGVVADVTALPLVGGG